LGNIMRIMIARHGKAEEKKLGIPDEERRLTTEGRREVEATSRILPWRPAIVLTSPLVRARESAEIIASIYGVEVKVVDELHPSILSLDAIKRIDIPDCAVLVGHAPSIENLVSELIGGGKIKLSTGSIAGVELEVLDKGKGVLRFLITPDIALRILSTTR